MITITTPTHPQAAAAVRLADLTGRTSRAYITQRLEAGDCPRYLYILACILRASRRVRTLPAGLIVNERI